MAVVRAVGDLQGGVARRDLENHLGRLGRGVVFREAAAVDGAAEGPAFDGDGGVADGGVRLGHNATAGTCGLDVVAAYHGALGRVGCVLNDPVFNDERRVAVDDGALARIVRLAAGDNVFGLDGLDGHLRVADGGFMLLVGEARGLLDVVAADDFINLCLVGEINGQVARGPSVIEVGLIGDLTRVMPPAADDLGIFPDLFSLSVDGECGTLACDASLAVLLMGRRCGRTGSEKSADTARDDCFLHVSSEILGERNTMSCFHNRKS